MLTIVSTLETIAPTFRGIPPSGTILPVTSYTIICSSLQDKNFVVYEDLFPHILQLYLQKTL